MERNVGTTDRRIRVALGTIAGVVAIAVLAGALQLSPLVALVLGLGAVILLVTGLVGVCGLYSVLGTNTCPVEQTE
ncbi:YgaP family membrane protein [Haloarcula onubensis]|uniref:DUF2892 domain-containing protein n=1 Tax=Haloarcula onubensis TaxID=2950539 RepID=A0ABU2FPT3_9EURY|nr:DUF2892 domain-containing protein [Halomicroarcula sp. S3CR25-11]MDS0282766.1 DUF2892 domain-containing protein [Halomicroarcula sp. S3CR25-11]